MDNDFIGIPNHEKEKENHYLFHLNVLEGKWADSRTSNGTKITSSLNKN